jgi:hypothetical protein
VLARLGSHKQGDPILGLIRDDHGDTIRLMHVDDVVTLFDCSYWANRQILLAAAELPVERPTEQAKTLTWRNLSDTLVFALDVVGAGGGGSGGSPKRAGTRR